MNFYKSIDYFINNPIHTIFIIVNLILMEIILSIDNAMILSSMIINLEEKEQKRAIKYGIIGACFFRCICLLFITYLVKIKLLKLLGGLYLIFTGLSHIKNKNKKTIKNKKVIPFWKVIVRMEIIDLVFSIDNIFASISLSNNLLLITIIGVFLGILFMRISTIFFVKFINKFKKFKNYIFLIIILLGVKLIFSFLYYFVIIPYYDIINNLFPFFTIFLLIFLILKNKINL